MNKPMDPNVCSSTFHSPFRTMAAESTQNGGRRGETTIAGWSKRHRGLNFRDICSDCRSFVPSAHLPPRDLRPASGDFGFPDVLHRCTHVISIECAILTIHDCHILTIVPRSGRSTVNVLSTTSTPGTESMSSMVSLVGTTATASMFVLFALAPILSLIHI